MTEPIRVLHIFGALNPGGVETLVMNLYRRIDRSRIQFDFALSQGEKHFFDDEVLSLGGRIYYFDQKKSLTGNLSHILKENPGYAAVHSHMYFYSGLFLKTAAKYGIPVRIAHAHNRYSGQGHSLIRRGYEKLMQSFIRRYATELLGCSRPTCEYVFGEGIMKDPRCSVLYNGFDVPAYGFNAESRRRIRREYGIGEQTVIGYVGILTECKNPFRLLSVFTVLRKTIPDAVLLLVGQGDLADAVKEKAAQLDIADACVFTGAQKDTPSYYSAMDVFLFPSLYEGLGSVLIEAQANGLHVVTFKGRGPRRYRRDGQRILRTA